MLVKGCRLTSWFSAHRRKRQDSYAKELLEYLDRCAEEQGGGEGSELEYPF